MMKQWPQAFPKADFRLLGPRMLCQNFASRTHKAHGLIGIVFLLHVAKSSKCGCRSSPSDGLPVKGFGSNSAVDADQHLRADGNNTISIDADL
jgi:hypothetical protein